MREAVLERGGYHCPVYDAPVEHERSIIMHHRVPGKSVLSLVALLRKQPKRKRVARNRASEMTRC